jgi:hypothetical protein
MLPGKGHHTSSPNPGPGEKGEQELYFEVEFRPEEVAILTDLLNGKHVPAYAIGRVRNALTHARMMELSPTGLDWDEVEAEAEKQGCSVGDILWDRMSAEVAPETPSDDTRKHHYGFGGGAPKKRDRREDTDFFDQDEQDDSPDPYDSV